MAPIKGRISAGVLWLVAATPLAAETVCGRDPATGVSGQKLAAQIAAATPKLPDEVLAPSAREQAHARRSSLVGAVDGSLLLKMPAMELGGSAPDRLKLFPRLNECSPWPSLPFGSQRIFSYTRTNPRAEKSGPLCINLQSRTKANKPSIQYDKWGGTHRVSGANYSKVGIFVGYAGSGNYPWDARPAYIRSNSFKAFELVGQSDPARFEFYYLLSVLPPIVQKAYEGHSASVSEPYDTENWAAYLTAKLSCLAVWDKVDRKAVVEIDIGA